ncbi:MAG: helix-turn-helix transcriptional regulator [Nitrospirae bacterium]|nr:helix-turn-helix transcriptional regulator [Nitrospirota bacterium]
MPRKPADPLAIVKKRQLPGVVVLDLALNVLAVNGQAAQRVMPDWMGQHGEVIANPLRGDVVRLARRVIEESLADPHVTDWAAVHLDGDSVYGLKAEFISPPGSMGADRLVLVHVDTVSLKREIDFDGVRRRWGVSRREQDVLRLLYYGKSNREIAELLFISEYTVKDHIKAIMAKMSAGNRAEIVYKLTTTA